MTPYLTYQNLQSGDAPFQPRAAKVDPEQFIPKPPAAAVAAVVKKEMETLAKSGREWKEVHWLLIMMRE